MWGLGWLLFCVVLSCSQGWLLHSRAWSRLSAQTNAYLQSDPARRPRGREMTMGLPEPSGQSSNAQIEIEQEDRDSLIASRREFFPSTARLSLVGSGPGDPDLLTVQALRLIQSASLVVADRLISAEILALVQCELKIAQKRPGCAEEAQEELYQWVADALRQGRHVVRLKIGDPFLFGRGGEEVLYFRALGVEATVAPGISSSYSAPLAACIPLTHRGVSNQVLISTGYGRDLAKIDLPTFAADRTVVLLMAVGRLEEIAANLTSAEMGYPKATPVAIVENATTPKQRTILGTLETIADVARAQNARAPACIIVGDVVNVLRQEGEKKSSPVLPPSLE